MAKLESRMHRYSIELEEQFQNVELIDRKVPWIGSYLVLVTQKIRKVAM